MNVFSKIRHKIEKDLTYWGKTDKNGVYHDICKQQKGHSCGMACVAMIVHRHKNIRLRESQLRQYSKLFDQGTGDTAGYKRGEGTDFKNLSILLRNLGVDYRYGYIQPDFIPDIDKNSAYIARVTWLDKNNEKTDDAHFIVIDGYSSTTKELIACDPYYGLVQCKRNGGRYEVGGGVVGKFDNHIVGPSSFSYT